MSYAVRPLDDVIADLWEIYDQTLIALKAQVLPKDGKKPVYAGTGAQLHIMSCTLTEITRLETRRDVREGARPIAINLAFRPSDEPEKKAEA